MRTIILTTLIILALVALVACQKTRIEVTPQATQLYTVQTIDSLLYIFETHKSHDTNPSDILFQAFIRDFPNAKDIDWEMAGYIYHVEFEIDHRDYKAFYDHSANLLSYGYEIKEYELPAVVKNSSVAICPDYHFEDIKKIVRGTETFYKLEMENNDIEKTLLLKNDGVVLSDYPILLSDR